MAEFEHLALITEELLELKQIVKESKDREKSLKKKLKERLKKSIWDELESGCLKVNWLKEYVGDGRRVFRAKYNQLPNELKQELVQLARYFNKKDTAYVYISIATGIAIGILEHQQGFDQLYLSLDISYWATPKMKQLRKNLNISNSLALELDELEIELKDQEEDLKYNLQTIDIDNDDW